MALRHSSRARASPRIHPRRRRLLRVGQRKAIPCRCSRAPHAPGRARFHRAELRRGRARAAPPIPRRFHPSCRSSAGSADGGCDVRRPPFGALAAIKTREALVASRRCAATRSGRIREAVCTALGLPADSIGLVKNRSSARRASGRCRARPRFTRERGSSHRLRPCARARHGGKFREAGRGRVTSTESPFIASCPISSCRRMSARGRMGRP